MTYGWKTEFIAKRGCQRISSRFAFTITYSLLLVDMDGMVIKRNYSPAVLVRIELRIGREL